MSKLVNNACLWWKNWIWFFFHVPIFGYCPLWVLHAHSVSTLSYLRGPDPIQCGQKPCCNASEDACDDGLAVVILQNTIQDWMTWNSSKMFFSLVALLVREQQPFAHCPESMLQVGYCGMHDLLAASLLWSFNCRYLTACMRFWYGWAFSDSLVQLTFQERLKCFGAVSHRASTLLMTPNSERNELRWQPIGIQ